MFMKNPDPNRFSEYAKNIFVEKDLCPEMKIFRYTSLTNLLQILERRTCRCGRRSNFSDRHEKGEFKDPKYKFSRFYYANETPPQSLREEWIAEDKRIADTFHYYASCWTCEELEDFLMWRAYACEGDGIRIGTTLGRLISSIQVRDKSVVIGKMKYDREKFLNTACDALFGHKTRCYQHEQELRLYVMEDSPCKTGDYIMLDVDPELVETVVMSPFIGPEIANFMREMLSEKYPFLKEKVMLSQIMEYRK